MSLKPDTYTESIDVDEAGISVKVSVHYPGRSLNLSGRLSSSRGGERDLKKSAEPVRVTIDKWQRGEPKIKGKTQDL